MVQGTIFTRAPDCFGYKGCIWVVKRLRFFSSTPGIDMTIKKSRVKQYRIMEQHGKVLTVPAGLEAGTLSEVRKVVFQKVYLTVLPPKNRPVKLGRWTLCEWVRNASRPGASERWCTRVATPQLCPVLWKCWLSSIPLTRTSQHARHLLKAFLRCQFTSNQQKWLESWSWNSSIPHRRKKILEVFKLFPTLSLPHLLQKYSFSCRN